jgi:hypothetical protein
MEVSGQIYALAALLQGKSLGTVWMEDSMGSRTGLDVMAKRTSLLLPAVEPRFSIP